MTKNEIIDDTRWRSVCLSPESSIRDAIETLNRTALQLVVVLDKTGVIVGTVSDGDIRRGLIKGETIDSQLSSVLFHNPVLVPEGLDRSHVEQLMRINKVRQVPVVDAQRRVIGLHLWDEVVQQESITNPFVIMAGGLGKRLMPLTKDTPKPMLKVSGRPILEHIILRAKGEGFRNFLISVNYLAAVIEEYFLEGERLGVNIRYLREKNPLGTAGGLSLVDNITSQPLIVSNGDVLCDIRFRDLLSFHIKHNADATMAIKPYEITNPFGVVRTSGIDILSFDEKPVFRSHINAGVYVVSSRALEHLQPGERCDMPDFFSRLKASGLKTIGYPMHEPWLDLGRKEDLDRAEELGGNR